MSVPGVVICSECEMINEAPSSANSMPSVATNEAIPTYAVMKPLNAPSRPAIRSDAITAGTSGSGPDSFQYRIGTNRYMPPIDRSISPSVITNTSPAAMIASGAKYGRIVLKLPPVRKCEVVTLK